MGISENMLISVIIPVYNAEKYLGKCLDSIVRQDYRELEIIIVDDGSTDGSFSICKEYAANDKRIRLIHQENGGLVKARKSGITAATGDYIGFVDADDHIDTGMYSGLLKVIDKNMPDMVLFGLKEVYPDHTVLKADKYEKGIYSRDEIVKKIFPSMLSYGNFFDFGILPNLVCKLIRTGFLQNSSVSVSDSVSVGEDVDATFQLMVQADSIQIIDEKPYNYCKRQDSMMWKPLSRESADDLENDLRSGFVKHGVYDVLKEQLKDYITFVRLLKIPDSVPEIDDLFSGDARIALYGAGGFGQALYNVYKERIVMWADRKFEMYSDKGLTVISPKELKDRQDEYDIVYISILDTGLCEKIRNELIVAGIKKKIMFWGSNA